MENKLPHEVNLNQQVFSSSSCISSYEKIGLTQKESNALNKYFIKKDARVLDIGCGSGRTTKSLFDLGFDVIGIDLSDGMVRRAKERFPQVTFKHGDACNLEFSEESFDYVLFSFNGIDCIFPEEKRIKALKEIHRVLKHDGVFVFSSHNSNAILAPNPSFYYWLINFTLLNFVRGTLFSTYKFDKTNDATLYLRFISPKRQRVQLQKNGYLFLDMIGFFPGFLKNFENWLYYVAKKQ